MNIDLGGLFDSYSRKARVFPALLSVFVPVVCLLIAFEDIPTSRLGATIAAFFGACGIVYALSNVARSRGKKVEKRLLTLWGAWPTTIYLRHVGPLDAVTRERYHRFLELHIAGLNFPTPEQESNDPISADLAYSSAVKWLKEHARLMKSNLVDHENAQYGFRRNLNGMRPVGIVGCLLVLVPTLIRIHCAHPAVMSAIIDGSWAVAIKECQLIAPSLLVIAAISIFGLLSWCFIVQDQWVREAADQYASALLACCDRPSKPAVQARIRST